MDEIENRMVIGEYPGAEEPDFEERCPFCGMVWRGYKLLATYQSPVNWENDDYDCIELDCDEWPIQNGLCRTCAWKKATPDNFEQYVAEEVVSAEIRLLSYAIHGDDVKKGNEDACKEIAETMKNHNADWWGELVRDFVEDFYADEFTEWMLARGRQKHD